MGGSVVRVGGWSVRLEWGVGALSRGGGGGMGGVAVRGVDMGRRWGCGGGVVECR